MLTSDTENSTIVILDVEPLRSILNSPKKGKPRQWLKKLLQDEVTIMLPAVVEYEFRRSLNEQEANHLLERLENPRNKIEHLPLDRKSISNAANYWSRLNKDDKLNIPFHELDADILLVAQSNCCIERSDEIQLITDSDTNEVLVEFADDDITILRWDQILNNINMLRPIKIVVASPSDVQAERDLLQSVIDEINRGVASDRHLILQLYRWETDTYPQFHLEGGQGAIDRSLRIAECDILIGIFWKRFGTPTADGRTGTEHEINIAIAAWERTNSKPQIMLYFNRQAYSPSSTSELDQWRSVLEYKQMLKPKGLLGEYEGVNDFRDKIRQDLTQLVRDQYPL